MAVIDSGDVQHVIYDQGGDHILHHPALSCACKPCKVIINNKKPGYEMDLPPYMLNDHSFVI